MRPFPALIAIVLPGTVAAETYYVSPGGHGDTPSDSNTLTAAQDPTTPWSTLTASIPKLACGDTLYVRGGTYSTEGNINFTQLCQEGDRIEVLNYPGEAPLISWADRQNTGNQIHFYKPGTQPSNVVGGVTIQGLELYNGYNGYKLEGAERVIIRDNVIHHMGENGILSKACLGCTADRNTIYDNGDITLDQCNDDPLCNQFHGFYIAGTGWTITNNLIYDNLGYGIQTHGRIFESAIDPSVSYCAFGALIANNTFAYQRNRSGIVLWNETDGVQLVAIIRNNIFYENSQSGTDPSGINVTSDGNVAGTYIENNVHYATGVTTFLGGTACTGCTVVGNSTTENPNMVNAPATMPASPDFHVIGGVAIDYGLNLYDPQTIDGIVYAGVTTDKDGAARPTSGNFEAGAYEFGAPLPPAAPSGLSVH